MDAKLSLRVFLSSPDDVRIERSRGLAIVQRLAREFVHHAVIEPVFWEHEPLTADKHWQDGITDPATTDIVVVIVWSKLGLQLPSDRYLGRKTGKPVTGTEWEFEAAKAANEERKRPDLLVYRKTAPITADLSNEQALAMRLAQRKSVEEFFLRWFGPATQAMGAVWPFDTPEAFAEMVYTHLRQLVLRRIKEARGVDAPPIGWFEGSPFRGLASYEQEHAAIFFGRAQASASIRDAALRRVAQGEGLVMVLGASGSGKSSLVKAGVLPQLLDVGVLPGTGIARHCVVQPGADGEPSRALAAGLLRALPELGSTEAELRRVVQECGGSAVGLCTLVAQAQRKAAIAAGVRSDLTAGLVVVLDQGEEALGVGEAERSAVAGALAGLARLPGVLVLVAMRSDAFARLSAREPGVRELLELARGDGLTWVQAPSDIELGQMIAEPARQAGLRFAARAEDGARLDEAIRAEAAREAGSLPLLSFVLDELYQRRSDDGLLTWEAYAQVGGLGGAIAMRADEIVGGLSAQARAALPAVIRLLARVDEGATETQGVRAQWASMSQLRAVPGASEVVERMLGADARLLVSDSRGGEQRVRVAHEALLTRWPLAKTQLAQDAAMLAVRERVQAAAMRYGAVRASGTPAAQASAQSLLLAPGLPLSEALAMVEGLGASVSEQSVAFVRASENAALEAERAREAAREARVRRAKVAAAVFAAIALCAVGAGVVAMVQQRRARAFAEEARQFSEFLEKDVLGAADGDREGGATATAAELLRDAATGIDERFAGNDAQRARVKATIGNLLVKMGELDAGDALLDDAEKLAATLDDSELVASVAGSRGEAAYRVAVVQEDIDKLEALIAEERARGEAVTLAMLLNHLAGAYKSRNSPGSDDRARAEAVYNEALALRRKLLGEANVDTLITRHNLNQFSVFRFRAAKAANELDKAKAIMEEGVALRKQLTFDTLAALGAKNAQTLATQSEELGMRGDLASLPEPFGNPAELARVLDEYPKFLTVLRQVLPDSNVRVRESLARYARELRNAGKHAQAIEPLTLALDLYRLHHGGLLSKNPASLVEWLALSYAEVGAPMLAVQKLAELAREANAAGEDGLAIRAKAASQAATIADKASRPELVPPDVRSWVPPEADATEKPAEKPARKPG
jgi:hypothetical protein